MEGHKMQIKKVSIEGDVDPFGGRALVVSTNSDIGTFKTPNRALTSQEFQYKARLPFPVSLDNDISEVIHNLYGKNWTKFTDTNGSFYNEKKNLDSFAVKMAHTIQRYYPRIASEMPISDEFIHRMIMLQRSGGKLDFITMPSLPPSAPMFEKTTRDFIEEVNNEKEEPLVYLDMGLDTRIFRDRFYTLLEFVKTGEIHSIGLIYRAWQKYSLNYDLLWNNRETEVFLQMSEIPRWPLGTPNLTSTMHLLQKYGIDSFSLKLATFGGDDTKKDKKSPIGGSKQEIFQVRNRLDSKPMVFRQFREWETHKGLLDCDCPICKEKSADEFMEAYYGDHEKNAGETLNAANNLHECYCSLEEFKQSRKCIVQGELKDYFKNKEGLNSFEIPISKSLFDF